ncbi:MAG: winged helix-turn-helix transcriptional regulator [Oscillospiraceae bacterium]|nr:winged helix-turn-helix transcriptional regulator [Oscillospiraceae bacterium]
MISADDKIKRMIEVSRLYYEDNCSQNEIAKKLGISRPLVSLILNEAKERGIVTISINDSRVTAEYVTEKLRNTYRIDAVITVPDGKNDDLTNLRVAEAAFHLCFSKANDGKHVGVGWGSILGRMADFAETQENAIATRGALFPLVGRVNSVTRGYHTNELVRIFSLKTGRHPTFLYSPALYETTVEYEIMKQSDAYRSIMEEWDFMEQALVSVSNFPSYPDLGVKSLYGNALTEKKAVGRVLAHYFDSYGRIISPLSESTFQASIQQLRQTNVTAVCSNQVRAQCVIGALRTGVINQLVLPYSLAEKVSRVSF